MEDHTIEVDGRQVQVEGDDHLNAATRSRYAEIVAEAARHHGRAREAIAGEAEEEGSATAEYLRFVLDQLPERAAALGIVDVATFLPRVYLHGIWAGDDGGELRVSFDYTVDHDAMDHVIAVGFDDQRRMTGIELES